MRTAVCSLLIAAAALVPGSVLCGEATSADLRLRIAPNDTVRYAWSIASSSESRGKERGRAFTLTTDSNFGMNLSLRGLAGKRENPAPATGAKADGGRAAVRIQDLVYTDKRSIENSKTELYVSKGRIKYVENGKVIVDSDNDIGLDRFTEYQQHVRAVENGEMRAWLDAAGRQSDIQGDPALVETLKSGGAQGIFPILSGKETKLGEAWEDTFSMPQIGEFKLAKPAVVRSKMTFSKWVAKDGKNLAQIDVSTAWDNQELKGENDTGLLVEISRVDGGGAGSCLFDPATGHFVEGAINTNVKYRIDGERDGQTTGLDVTGKTRFTFTEK